MTPIIRFFVQLFRRWFGKSAIISTPKSTHAAVKAPVPAEIRSAKRKGRNWRRSHSLRSSHFGQFSPIRPFSINR